MSKKQQYRNVTLDEMDALLAPQGFEQIPPEKLGRTREVVYGKRVDQDDLMLTLRVFTGIEPTGQSRDCGKDAIRVRLFMRNSPGERALALSGDKRVHRIQTWAKNLQSRIDNWLDLMPKHKCPECGKPLLPRKGSRGPFLGCAGYSSCKFTQEVEK